MAFLILPAMPAAMIDGVARASDGSLVLPLLVFVAAVVFAYILDTGIMLFLLTVLVVFVLALPFVAVFLTFLAATLSFKRSIRIFKGHLLRRARRASRRDNLHSVRIAVSLARQRFDPHNQVSHKEMLELLVKIAKTSDLYSRIERLARRRYTFIKVAVIVTTFGILYLLIDSSDAFVPEIINGIGFPMMAIGLCMLLVTAIGWLVSGPDPFREHEMRLATLQMLGTNFEGSIPQLRPTFSLISNYRDLCKHSLKKY